MTFQGFEQRLAVLALAGFALRLGALLVVELFPARQGSQCLLGHDRVVPAIIRTENPAAHGAGLDALPLLGVA